MAKSQKSATLPPNFLLKPQPGGEDNEGFFTKLKKRLKFKKGKYNIDINTGECENVSAVSFRKRESQELLGLDEESPLKYQVGRSSERVTRSASPKTSKPASRTNSERVVAGTKEAIDRTSVVRREQDGLNLKESPLVTRKVGKDNVKGNEYSHINFDREDPVITKPPSLANEPKVKNYCLLNDDSAIDLDSYDVDSNQENTKIGVHSSHRPELLPIDPGYEKLPFETYKIKDKQAVNDRLAITPEDEPGYASVGNIQRTVENHRQTETDDTNIDPSYESIKEIKAKLKNRACDERLSKSVESLDDPNYQSINDVKRQKEDMFGAGDIKPRKTYSMFESIESLDEPGYESLNDIKKRINEQNFRQTVGPDFLSKEPSKVSETDAKTTKSVDMDDSAVGLANESVNLSHAGSAVEGEADAAPSKLTESAKSKDSGFESKAENEKSPELENPEDLYSKVRKRSEEPEPVSKSSAEAQEPVLSGDSEGRPEEQGSKGKEEYDSDVELLMDPGYAECADAIKGFVPASVYSDGSGSRISSCNSLNLSVEDFITEPGYAECADAIKTGVIKKISVSNERLVDAVKVKRHSVDEATLRKGAGPEIYANPQILFRKRSKLLEEGSRNSGEFTGSSESLMSNSSAKSKEVEVKKEEDTVLEAPPLPARNYSLYLDNEEADKIIPSPEALELTGNQGLEDIDDAFELEQESESCKKLEHSREVKEGMNEMILKMESALKEELRNEPLLKTPDDVDEVTRAIETNFPDAIRAQYDPLACLEEIDNDEDDDEKPCVSGEFLVKIPLESGGMKLIKITEKKESAHFQEKRKISRYGIDSKGTTGDSNCGSQTSTICDQNICDISTEQKELNEPIKHSLKDRQVTKQKDTGNDQMNAYHNDSCEIEPKGDKNSEAIHTNVPHQENFQMSDDHRTRLKQHFEASSAINELTMGTSVEMFHGDNLQVSHLKMISLSSMESDDDLDSVEPLPKLEIVETDLESALDDSGEIEAKSNESSDSVDTNEVFKDELDNTPAVVEVKVEAKTSDHKTIDLSSGKQDETGCESSNMNNKALNSSEKSSTLDTRLVVLASESEGADMQNGFISDEGCVVDENDTKNDPGESETREVSGDGQTTSVKVTTPRLCELSTCAEMIPNLYLDTEPTHMSLSEVMHLSGADISAIRTSSEADISLISSTSSSVDGHTASSAFLGPSFRFSESANHIPGSTKSPPPRPPHSSNPSSKHTPTEEVPPTSRLISDENYSADEASPPAIPPRSKIRKQPRPVSASQDFMESMRQLKDCGWYWGPLSWEEAEQKLANKPEGTFLVRDSSDERYILSLSFKNQGRVHHTRIEHHKGHFSFWSQPDSHGKSTIKEFIEQCVNNSRNGRFLYFIRPSGPGSPPMPIHLLHPVSRFVQLYSLQHMCRFRILQMVRRDHIDSLPVPTRIKQYLKEAQYYVEYLDD